MPHTQPIEAHGELREHVQSFMHSHARLRQRAEHFAGNNSRSAQLFMKTTLIAEVIQESMACEPIKFTSSVEASASDIEEQGGKSGNRTSILVENTLPSKPSREERQRQTVSTYLAKCEIPLSINGIADSLKVSWLKCIFVEHSFSVS
jgi:hypothetical protein